MAQQNPFADFRSDPFFSFGTNFSKDIVPATSLGVYGDIFEEEPELPFQAALQRANPAPNLLRMFQGQRDDLFEQFQGLQARQILMGQQPTLRFADFMGNFNFEREAYRTPPSQRPGGGTSQFAPRTEFLR